MKFLIILVALATACFGAGDAQSIAARLAKQARQAEKSGRVVRAYLLYTEAAVRDPKNPAYAIHRGALAGRAKLLMQADVENT
ncbi:MAG: hypothetical protein M3Y57_04735, partial [Acidobacteriota bacterium]|nr:hypothetical protein [Acidobacteriota bacterium]